MQSRLFILCLLIHGSLGAGGCCLNLLLIVAVMSNKKTRVLAAAKFLLNILIANFVFATVFLPIHILVLFKGKPTRGLETVHLAFAYFLRLASVCGCTMIAFDRFMYVCYPFRYLIYLVDTQVNIMIVSGWLISISFVIYFLQTGILAYPFIGANVALVVLFCLKIYWFAYKARQTIRIRHPHLAARNHKFLTGCRGNITIAIITGTSLASWLPVLIVGLYPSWTSQLLPWASLIPSLNICLGPYIYCLRIISFRTAVYKILKRRTPAR